MINGRTVLGIIPARGGSKGVPQKNLRHLAGKPLVAWTIEEATKSKYVDRIILSSENQEVIKIAREWGCEVPFIRPRELASDDTPGIEPVIHAIGTIPEKYDYVCLLQPTSPLREAVDIDSCIENCVLNDAPSCVSVVEAAEHPYWMYRISPRQALVSLFPDRNVTRRQDLPKVYALNGAVYVAKTEIILEEKTFLSEGTIGYVMKRGNSLDIDEEIDFVLAELLLKDSGEA